MEFLLQFAAPQLQFPQRYDLGLVRVEEAFTLSFHPLLALLELLLLDGQRRDRVLFGLCPTDVELR